MGWIIGGIIIFMVMFLVFFLMLESGSVHPAVTCLITFALLFIGLLVFFTPVREESKRNDDLKKQWRQKTGLNVTQYADGGIIIECTVPDGVITLDFVTTTMNGVEQLLHFDNATATYEEINLSTYKKWYPYDCASK